MIVAAGLTPAWQQILLFDQMRLGEVNRAREAHWVASGKVLNVGHALNALGGECLTLSTLGGAPREAIQRQFAEAGARANWIEVAQPTRVCTTILDRASGQTTELVENAGAATPGEIQAFREAYRAAVAAAPWVVLTGSLPAETPVSFYADLLRETPSQAILDVRGAELLAALEQRPFLVKPNREELRKTLGRDLHDDASLRQAMSELHRRGAAWVVVTQGASDVWLSSPQEAWRLTPPKTRVVNPIGCGDCLAAGIAWSLRNGAAVIEAVRFGVACAAENASQLLPARLNLAKVQDRVGHVTCRRAS